MRLPWANREAPAMQEKLRVERGERGLFFELSSTSGMAPKYDVVVVGSGYGAGCAALRFSKTTTTNGTGEPRNLRVAVLERGREMLPGSFPETVFAGLRQIHLTVHKCAPKVGDAAPPLELGSKAGLFDLRVFGDNVVVQGCGLGGTSLVNANVVIEADKKIYTDASSGWPQLVQNDFEDHPVNGRVMDQYFATAKGEIGVRKYPDNWPQLSKLEALKYATQQAARMPTPIPLHRHAMVWEKTPIAVNFTERRHAASGYVQPACNLCGNCCSGCNTGAKNTVNTNYIADAWANGAEIFTGLTVTRVEKSPAKDAGWVVYFRPTDELERPAEWEATGERFVLADRVVLGAGSLGSTEILLRSQAESGLNLSDMLGHHYSGNGDSLGAATGIVRKVASVGNASSANESQDNNFAVGPCITSVTSVTEIEELGHEFQHIGQSLDFVVEDCAVPGVLRSVTNSTVNLNKLQRQVRRVHNAQRNPGGIGGPMRRILAHGVVPRVRRGASDHAEPFLVMSHDDSITTGIMTLDANDHLVISWNDAAQQPAYAHSEAVLKHLGTALQQSDFMRNPAIHTLQKAISVHPLGGACMGDGRGKGVVNHCGQVFDGTLTAADDAVHAGLYCMDGSIVPTSLGTNPLLTITALAERCMVHILRNDNDLNARDEMVMCHPRTKPVDPRLAEARTMVTFTERMAGKVGSGVDEKDLSLVVAVQFKSLEKLVTNPATPGMLSGTVRWGNRCLSVCSGEFRLFAVDESVVAGRRMVYNFVMTTASNEMFHFVGYKTVERRRYSPWLLQDIWAGTTTLHVIITSQQGDRVWRGTLRISLCDLGKQMLTMRAWRVGALSRKSTWTELCTFLFVFAKQVWRIYIRLYSGDLQIGPLEPLRMVGHEVLEYRSRQDGARLGEGGLFQPMTYYPSISGGFRRSPVVLLHGMAVSSAIFSTVTIDTNLVEHFTSLGFDVYVPELRMSIAVPEVSAREMRGNETFGLDTIATHDIPGAIAAACDDFAERHTLDPGNVSACVLGHCAGGAALAITLLHEDCGDTRNRLEKVAFSQVSIFSEPARGNKIKATFHLSRLLSFAPLMGYMLAFGLGGAFLWWLRWMGWYSAGQVWVAAIVPLGMLVLWARWRLPGIDPGAHHWPLFDWAAGLWAWSLTFCWGQCCSQVCCHWITFLYGLLYQHENLNHATHAAFPTLFGFGGMGMFHNIAASCRRGCVVAYTVRQLNDAIDRFVLTKVPVLVVHGMKNRCWSRSGAEKTVEALRESADRVEQNADMYQLEEVKRYGHLDCIFGKTAAQDVFSRFSDFFLGGG